MVKFAGMSLTRRMGRGCLCPASGVQWFANPLVQNLAMGPFTVLPKDLLLSPPCGPGPLPWRPCLGWGSGAPPLCFAPLFFPCFPPLLQLGDHADNRLRGEIRTSFGRFGSSFDSDSVEAQATSGSPRPCLATKTSESCANSAKRLNQQRTVSSYLFGVSSK